LNHRVPRISIGLPVYNGAAYIAQSIDSLLAQTYDNFELVICDNASTDATEAICRAYAARDPRVQYHRNARNRGVGYNHRRAFELSRGEYFRWAGADDITHPRLLEQCAAALDSQPSAVLAYPRTLLIDDAGAVIEEYEDRLHLQGPDPVQRLRVYLKVIRRCNAVYGLIRSEVLERTGLLGDIVGADMCLLAELTLHGTFFEVPEFLFSRRIHAGSVAGTGKDDHARVQRAFRPDVRPGLRLEVWRHQFAHFRAAGRAPLSADQKLRVYGFLMHYVVMRRRRLIKEATGALVGLVSPRRVLGRAPSQLTRSR
jgi:glycosyltransferase involved in cell wall biosynthesis